MPGSGQSEGYDEQPPVERWIGALRTSSAALKRWSWPDLITLTLVTAMALLIIGSVAGALVAAIPATGWDWKTALREALGDWANVPFMLLLLIAGGVSFYEGTIRCTQFDSVEGDSEDADYAASELLFTATRSTNLLAAAFVLAALAAVGSIAVLVCEVLVFTSSGSQFPDPVDWYPILLGGGNMLGTILIALLIGVGYRQLRHRHQQCIEL